MPTRLLMSLVRRSNGEAVSGRRRRWQKQKRSEAAAGGGERAGSKFKFEIKYYEVLHRIYRRTVHKVCTSTPRQKKLWTDRRTGEFSVKDSLPGLAVCVDRDVARYAGVVRSQLSNREIWKLSDRRYA